MIHSAAMWYLIISPIVVVLALSFLLWYLSRKESDPVVAQKVQESKEQEKSISFPRTREFFLKILEKSGQRFKVISLRTHNTLHDFTQSVKVSRRKVHTAIMTDKIREGSEERRKEDKGFYLESEPASVTNEKNNPTGVNFAITATKKDETLRPMVSERVAQPEQKRSALQVDTSREEDIIARIAMNPKDFTAYEELGDYYLEMGSLSDAKGCYRQVLKFSPAQRMVKIKIRRLEKLLTRGGE